VGLQVTGRACRYLFPTSPPQKSGKLTFSTDLITFICIVVFILKLKAGYGQSRMNRLMRTILQDGVLYFFVMAAFHIAMVFFAFLGRVIRFALCSFRDAS